MSKRRRPRDEHDDEEEEDTGSEQSMNEDDNDEMKDEIGAGAGADDQHKKCDNVDQSIPSYQHFFNSLCSNLEKQQPSTFVCSNTIKPILPGLTVQGVGEIGLPICREQAELVIAQCTQAPFGRGEQTIIDTTVRNTWQLEPSQFSLENPEWETSLNNIISEINISLNFPHTTKIEAKLYKLLLYTQGGHFQKHKDTEKEQGMFGSLIIELPSNYTGGHLIVENGSSRMEYDFTADCRFTSHYVAFYAECLHQLMPVTKGYRLCLVYNLIQTQQQQSVLLHHGQPTTDPNVKQPLELYFNIIPTFPITPTVPDTTTTTVPITSTSSKPYLSNQVSHMIQQWVNDPNKKKHYLMFILSHQYSQKGIAWHRLKGSDRTLVVCLQSAQQLNNNFSLYLAQISGSQESLGSENRDDDDDENSSTTNIYDSDSQLSNLIDQHGNNISWGMSFNRDMKNQTWIAPENRMTFTWDDVQAHATGNDGVEYERSYQRWILMLVPHNNECETQWSMAGGPQYYSTWFTKKYHIWKNTQNQDQKQQTYQTCCEIAKLLLDDIKNNSGYGPRNFDSKLISSILSLNDITIIKRIIQECIPSSRDLNFDRTIIEFCEYHDYWDDMLSSYETLFPFIDDNSTIQDNHYYSYQQQPTHAYQYQISLLYTLAGIPAHSSQSHIIDPEIGYISHITSSLIITNLPADLITLITSYHVSSRRHIVHHLLSRLVNHVITYITNHNQLSQQQQYNIQQQLQHNDLIQTLLQQLQQFAIIIHADTIMQQITIFQQQPPSQQSQQQQQHETTTTSITNPNTDPQQMVVTPRFSFDFF